ncbi:ankyrin repeat domain-containing protein [Oceaniferula spumae]
MIRRTIYGITAISLMVLLALGGFFLYQKFRKPTPDEFVKSCRHGDLREVKRGIRKGCDPDARALWGWRNDIEGESALTAAAESGQTEVINMLLDHGAGVNRLDGFGRPAVVAAVRSGKLGVVRLLVARGADASMAGQDGISALHMAAALGHIEIMRYLLDSELSIDAQSKSKNSPLLSAVYTGQVESVDFLLSKGADKSVRNTSRKTALEETELQLAQFERYYQEKDWDEDDYKASILPYQKIKQLLQAE